MNQPLDDDLRRAEEHVRQTRRKLRQVVVSRTAAHDQVIAMLREIIRKEMIDSTADPGVTVDFMDYCRQMVSDDAGSDPENFAAAISYAVVGQMMAEISLDNLEQQENDE